MKERPDHGESFATRLARADLAFEMWTSLVDRTTATLVSEFESRGIDTILLKGPAFARLLYDDASERPYSDTDLLVQAVDRERAEQALGARGFVRVDRDEDWLGPDPKYAHTFQRPTDSAIVDLHWRLSGACAPPERVWAALRPRTEIMQIGCRQVTVPDASACAVLIALHNAHHGNARPRTLTDLDRAVERLDFSVWWEAAAIAARLEAADDFAAGMRLTPAGDALADRLRLGTPSSVEMWLKTNPSSYGAWALDRFTQTRDLSGRLRISFQILVPPPTVMRTFFPMSRRGTLGLVLAYALRPVRLLTNAAPAIRDWRRARRAMRVSAGRTVA